MFRLVIFSLFLLSLGSCGGNFTNLSSFPATSRDAPAGNTAGWQLISEYRIPPDEGSLTNSFAFTEDFRLWSRGSSDSKANQLMYSDDFGKSWKFVDAPDRGLGADGIVRFFDSKHGWAMDTSSILRTEDGGRSWKSVTVPNESRINTLNTLEFTDAEHGYLAGSTTLMERGSGTINFGIEILCTRDSGSTWRVCYKNRTNNTVLEMISVGDSTLALVDHKTLLITSDKGMTWKQKRWEFPATDIAASPNGVLWTTGEDGFLRSSKDLGDTWEITPLENSKDPNFRWTSISFDKTGLGVAVGSNGNVSSTPDGGFSWELHNLSLASDLWTVRVQSPYVAILDQSKLSVFRIDKR
ncbi:MAG TPA: YCF48-related protein [Pyrinomonadaceae bacterium]|nr:YCF48-related protein [Pyrinomonadaceae bacterium]